MKSVLLVCASVIFGLCAQLHAEVNKDTVTIEYAGSTKLEFKFSKKERIENHGWSVMVKLKNLEDHGIKGISYRLDFYEGTQKISWTSCYYAVTGTLVRPGEEIDFTLAKEVASSIDRIVVYKVETE
jgi:hypothetical protein